MIEVTPNGLVVTLLLVLEIQPAKSCVTVNVIGIRKFLGLPVPKSLQINVPTTPVAVTSDEPQLSTTANVGAAGVMLMVKFKVTTLSQPFTLPPK